MSARPHVTITLGRSGQVVKRPSQYDDFRSDHDPKAGSKRPIRERLENNLDDPHSYGSKHNDKRVTNMRSCTNVCKEDNLYEYYINKVVKRPSQYDDIRSDHDPKAGSKRPIRERLENNLDDPHSYGSKHNDKRVTNMRSCTNVCKEDNLYEYYINKYEDSVPNLLHSLGLGKYSILFQAEEVDMTALKQMGDNDLKELGIPMGPRKKILLALLPRSKHGHS